jgi:hypothetical protein
MKHLKLPALAFCLFALIPCVDASVKGLCKFDTGSLRFKGTAAEQTACLMRFVRFKGTGSTVQDIPEVLLSRVGTDTTISADQLKTCLAAANVDLAQVGGDLVVTAGTKKLTYFVLHDTSSPEIAKNLGFPTNINEAAWSGNNMVSGHGALAGKVSFIVNRVGQSRNTTPLGDTRSKPATKLEMNSQVKASRPFFVHVENIMPRLRPSGSWGFISPDPAFTDATLERLAWLYVVSSVRAGHWLIPAQHFNIDSDLFPGVDVHDDPQGFDLTKWGDQLSKVIAGCQP